MKLFQIILMFCVIAENIDAMEAQSQIEIFDGFSNKSWKSDKTLKIDKIEQTIELHIVQALNAIAWRPSGDNKTKIIYEISNEILSNVKEHYTHETRSADNAKWRNDLDLYDSPGQWMDKLNLRDFYRFQHLISTHPQLINNSNHVNDGLVKARSLCGTFWIVDSSDMANITAERAFSGMLVPNQAFGSVHYEVYTCAHGFTMGNTCKTAGIVNNNIAYYFVPYGVLVHNNSEDTDHFVATKGFRVTEIKCGIEDSAAFKSIDDQYFEQSRIVTVNPYNQDDYASVKINPENASERRNTLKETLEDAEINGTKLNIVQSDDKYLQNINSEFSINLATQFNPHEHERLFII